MKVRNSGTKQVSGKEATVADAWCHGLAFMSFQQFFVGEWADLAYKVQTKDLTECFLQGLHFEGYFQALEPSIHRICIMPLLGLGLVVGQFEKRLFTWKLKTWLGEILCWEQPECVRGWSLIFWIGLSQALSMFSHLLNGANNSYCVSLPPILCSSREYLHFSYWKMQ